MVTPLRDGMNLVAKEFRGAGSRRPGVLLLSQFAGAAKELDQALIVNPHETDAVATALKRALEMPLDERRERDAPMLRASLEERYQAMGKNLTSALVDRGPGRSLREMIRALLRVFDRADATRRVEKPRGTLNRRRRPRRARLGCR